MVFLGTVKNLLDGEKIGSTNLFLQTTVIFSLKILEKNWYFGWFKKLMILF